MNNIRIDVQFVVIVKTRQLENALSNDQLNDVCNLIRCSKTYPIIYTNSMSVTKILSNIIQEKTKIIKNDIVKNIYTFLSFLKRTVRLRSMVSRKSFTFVISGIQCRRKEKEILTSKVNFSLHAFPPKV